MVVPQEKSKFNNIGSIHADNYSALPKSVSIGHCKSLPHVRETFPLEPRKTVELTEKEKNFVRSLSCSMGGGDRQAAGLPGQQKFRPVIGDGSSHPHYHDFPASPVPHFYQPHHHPSPPLHPSTALPGNICMGMPTDFVQSFLQGPFPAAPLPPCYFNNGCMGPFLPGYHLPASYHHPGDSTFKYTNVLDSLLPQNPMPSVMDILTPPPEKTSFNESPSGGGPMYKISKKSLSSSNGTNNNNSQNNGSSNPFNNNSKLLEEFRNGRAQNLDLIAIKDDIYAFATDQHGSRFIQQKFDAAPTSTRNVVFEAILPHTLNLMKDVFGNYIVQKFFESGDKNQRSQLLDMVRGHLVELSLNIYGCRVIQKAVENAEECDVQMILSELRVGNKVIKCMVDQHGNHVIQKVFEHVKPDSLNFIIDIVENCCDELSIVSLAKHNYGCRVLQKMLKHLLPHQKEFIVQQLQSHLDELLVHQYGNYVIQELFKSSSTVVKHYIVIFIKADLEKYSMDKFASNVIEKCLIDGDQEQVKTLVTKIFEVPFEDLLYRMIGDQFGNYVVQKMLDVCDIQNRKKLIAAIKPKQAFLKKLPFGKHILAKCSESQSSPQKDKEATP
uniref:Maternal protein pumilio (inferred by orthology to a D. melanogaster protein) n=1 Tax=Strongyloides venezuelensis TaxID=75913 RepID=A0A0K0EW93_STRVS